MVWSRLSTTLISACVLGISGKTKELYCPSLEAILPLIFSHVIPLSYEYCNCTLSTFHEVQLIGKFLPTW